MPTIVFLAVVVLHQPADRFQPVSNYGIALDRQTGQLCESYTKESTQDYPSCFQLARQWHLFSGRNVVEFDPKTFKPLPTSERVPAAPVMLKPGDFEEASKAR